DLARVTSENENAVAGRVEFLRAEFGKLFELRDAGEELLDLRRSVPHAEQRIVAALAGNPPMNIGRQPGDDPADVAAAEAFIHALDQRYCSFAHYRSPCVANPFAPEFRQVSTGNCDVGARTNLRTPRAAVSPARRFFRRCMAPASLRSSGISRLKPLHPFEDE